VRPLGELLPPVGEVHHWARQGPEHLAHVERGDGAAVEIALEQPEHERVGRGRQPGSERRRRRDRLLEQRLDDGDVAAAGEQPRAGEDLVERGAEREEIRARVVGLGAQLLGRHVRELAADCGRS
jgi:hypothetical protein